MDPEDKVWDSYLPSGERVGGVYGKVSCPHCWEGRGFFVRGFGQTWCPSLTKTGLLCLRVSPGLLWAGL